MQGDRDLIFQALVNLLDNAVKYSPDGGVIYLSMEPAQGGTGRGHIIITDSGPGIPAEAHDDVFQKFFRLDRSRGTTGSGLGLSLVAAVAKMHGIDIRLSDNNPGLKVDLVLPAFKAVEQASHS